jgi:hypothetical protein
VVRFCFSFTVTPKPRPTVSSVRRSPGCLHLEKVPISYLESSVWAQIILFLCVWIRLYMSNYFALVVQINLFIWSEIYEINLIYYSKMCFIYFSANLSSFTADQYFNWDYFIWLHWYNPTGKLYVELFKIKVHFSALLGGPQRTQF